jgi:CheY-like chemotaxis protein
VHELGTNARKYGSLSVPSGKLAVHWLVRTTNEERNLLLHWEESGGPKVSAPASSGFGTTLIEKSLQAHGGSACVHYRAQGLTCEITLPLPERTTPSYTAALEAHAQQRRAPGLNVQGPTDRLRGARVLVVEDEPLVAMDVAANLTEAGCTVVGPAATLEKAKALIDAGEFDAALIDANLGGQPVDDLAAALTRGNAPFAFLTGYGREGLPQAFRHATMVGKPFNRHDLLGAVGQLLRREERVVPLRQKAP